MNGKALDVYLHDERVGQLKQNRSGVLSFLYSSDYLDKASFGISLCLPLQEASFKGRVVKAFFSGLLPDEGAKQRLARALGVSEENVFALLSEVGRDCAGALSFYPEGERPGVYTDEVETLDEGRLKDALLMLKRKPCLAGEKGMRLSLAGAQDKLPVIIEEGQVALPIGGGATTHIVKPLIERVEDSVYNEWFCMRLAKIVGLSVPDVSFHFAQDLPYFVVERYDRLRLKDGVVGRIHQEDFCQALGVLPEIKYEREGGPNFEQCRKLVFENSARPAIDQISLIKRVIFNYLIGNADAHGKNFSFLYKDVKPELSPAYDLMCTAVYDELSSEMAMKIGGRYKSEEVFLRHWYRLVPDTQVARDNIEKWLFELSDACLEQSVLLRDEFLTGGLQSRIIDDICREVDLRVERVRGLLAGGF